MQVSSLSITAIQKVITGDSLRDGDPLAPYRSGPDLVDFFNQFGADDQYGQGFPSRWLYTEGWLNELNGSKKLRAVIESAVDPRHFLGSEFPVSQAVDYLNKFLDFDGHKIVEAGKRFRVQSTVDEEIVVGGLFSDSRTVNREFLQDQLNKCDRKVADGDLTGAITNARSLVEGVLREIEGRLAADPPKYDGSLSKLYKRVYRLMNLDPAQEGLNDAAREILGGLISAVSGLAPMRNMASDAHVLEYAPR